MKYLVELVFGVGFLGLCGMVLFFFLRFLLLAWAVQVAGHVVKSTLHLIGRILHALFFVVGTAFVGAFIVGFALQIAMNVAAGGNASASPVMPVLSGFLAFFVLLALRGWQWRARHNRQKATASVGPEVGDADEASEQADYPAGYENVAEAWSRAIALAPRHRDELLGARATCAALVAAVECQDHIPDSAMIETAALIRNHLAALVNSTERRLLGAKPSERKAKIEEMVKFLLGFAQRAQQDMQAVGLSADDEDSALRAHLATQLFG